MFGFGTIEPAEESNPLSGLGTGTLIWWTVSNLIALFAGGFLAARVGVSFYHKSGMIQGVMTWALYTFFSAWLLTSAVGSILSGVGNTIGGVLSGGDQQEQTSQNQQQAVEQQNNQMNITLEEVKREFYRLLEDTDKPALDPDNLESRAEGVAQDAQDEAEQLQRRSGSVDATVEDIFSNAKNAFEDTWEELDKQALVNVVVERTNMNEQEATNAVDNVIAKYEDMRGESAEFLERVEREAAETAGQITQALSDAALYLFIALVLGLITAAAGGSLGVKSLREDYLDSEYIRTEHDAYTREPRDSARMRGRDFE